MANGQTRVTEKLEKALLPDEEVLWQGAPNTFRLFEADAKRGILCKWIGSAAMLALTVYFCLKTGKSFQDIWLLPVVLLLIAVSPLFERYTLGRYRYWITNKRALLMASDGSFCSMDQDCIDDYRIIRDRTGGDCLILGSQIFDEAPRQLRWQACHPRTEAPEADGSGPNLGMVFYALPDADTAARQLLCGREST